MSQHTFGVSPKVCCNANKTRLHWTQTRQDRHRHRQAKRDTKQEIGRQILSVDRTRFMVRVRVKVRVRVRVRVKVWVRV